MLNAATGEVIRSLGEIDEAVNAIGFTPDGKKLTATTYDPDSYVAKDTDEPSAQYNHTVAVWDVATCKQLGIRTLFSADPICISLDAESAVLQDAGFRPGEPIVARIVRADSDKVVQRLGERPTADGGKP